MWPCQVYDGVREVRRAVLMNRGEEEIDTDTEWDEFDETSEVITDIDSDDDDDDNDDDVRWAATGRWWSPGSLT